MSHLNYPNESAEYREARNKLLAEEIALRRQIEAVAALRRALPPAAKCRRIISLGGSARALCLRKWKCRSSSTATKH